MTHSELLEKSMIQYHDARGWYTVPCFLEVKTELYGDSKKHVDFGMKAGGGMRKWQEFVPQLPHMLESLKTFKSCRLGQPANSLALLTGKHSGLFVIDIDDDSVGMKFLSSIGVKIYADSLCVRSPSGRGSHLYFKWDPRLDDVKTTLSKFFGKDVPVDIRGEGGLIFCPPSKVRVYDGEGSWKHYCFDVLENGQKAKLRPPPEALIKYLLERKKDRDTRSSINASTCVKSLDSLTEKQREVFTRVIDELAACPVGTRSEQCFGALCTFIRFEVSPDSAWETIKGVSKFSERDRAYFDDMWNNALSCSGESSYKKGDAKPTPEQKAAAIIARPTAQDFLDYKPVKRNIEMIGYPCFRRCGLSMICGDPGVGKTTLALDLVRAAAKGEMCWDKQADWDEPRKVLVFHGDLNSTTLQEQYLTRMGMSMDDPQVKYLVLSDMRECVNSRIDLSTGQSVASFELLDANNKGIYRDIIALTKPDLIVVDTLTSFMSGDQNDIGVMKDVLHYMKHCSSEFNCHTLVLHHSRKRTNENQKPRRMTLDDVRGSSAIAALVDFAFGCSNAWDVEGQLVKGAGIVHPIKVGSAGVDLKVFEDFTYRISNDASGGVVFDYAYGGAIPTSTVPVVKEDDRVISLLKKLQEPHRYKELREFVCSEFSVCTKTADTRIATLVSQGLLQKTKIRQISTYSLTDVGRQKIPLESQDLNEPEQQPLSPPQPEEIMMHTARLSDDEYRTWYNDRTKWGDITDFPTELPEWSTVEGKWPEEQVCRYSNYIAQMLWYRRDKFGNMRYQDLMGILKSPSAEMIFDYELASHIVRSMINADQVWYHTHYDKDGNVEEIYLHPARSLEEKFLRHGK